MIRVDGGLTLIGPTTNVCVDCAENARLATARAPRQNLRLKGLIAPAFQPLVAALQGQERDTVIAIRTDLGLVSTHRITPGNCCSPEPVSHKDTSTPAGELRTPNDKTTVDGLKDAVVDFRHGPVTALFRTGNLPLATVTAELDSHTAGYGRTTSFEEAERVAIFEAIERLNGMRPRVPSTLEASFAELGPDQALDPERLGLNDFGNTYHPDLRIRWTPGWSYTRRKPIQVPEQVAYWGAHTPPEQRFLHETSNGCGLGNSLTEAVLHGLFEVAERDAFLMAWYAQTPLRKIKLPNEPLLHHLTDRLAELGYELLFLDATNDLGIPAVLSLARARRSDLPQAFFAAGASPDPTKAMRSAAVEVAVDVEAFADRARENPENYQRERLLSLLHDPTQVRSMDDHVAVNTLPEAKTRYASLVSDEPPQALNNQPRHTDLKELLDHYTEDLKAKGLELIAVDQSDPHTANTLGLHSAKVIVPGTLPMTFGHLHRRTRGLPRLDLQAGHPHPFP
ncbi:ribosomal protein S12 methylthiotransferase accessory factor [Lentzea waywayandensis]|uniref:Ribosomal protein S12 methylthiotransferase accessory factor n=1 Tax=Lentzea waywayandensis TaxID=84724 RepID=A0A1I6DLS4_9PSEU|nr:YcaO-like family protein [Lentzea waywayandensis]SFR06415.1 ribosomal protein S12 methylthiotransferase accessory factor [Lentzea waywayandensis]